MFYDYAKIHVKAGDGGNGVVAFRREKYVPRGGPAGGDGGQGGSVILKADAGLRTLVDFRYQSHYTGDRGAHGQGSKQHGRSAEDRILMVPVGTIVRDAHNKVIADLVRDGQEVVVAKGGKGGRGNARFVSSTHRAPTLAENGDAGEERWITLELKLLADVGLIGFPNVGKSTIIAHVSAARPKIADYHFTTLTPNLGMVRVDFGKSFVMADIPGLIEGAAEGAGLGHRFLRHTERTRILIHVLDISGSEGRDPVEDFRIVNEELGKYNPRLLERPMLLAANKTDIDAGQMHLATLQAAYPDLEIFPVSAVTGEGLSALVYRISQLLDELGEVPVEIDYATLSPVIETDQTEKFTITKTEGNRYVVTGPEIDHHFHRTQFDNDEAIGRFLQIIEVMGVIKALRKAGAVDGDTIVIKDVEFDFMD